MLFIISPILLRGEEMKEEGKDGKIKNCVSSPPHNFICELKAPEELQ
jgi:hypothetical protein